MCRFLLILSFISLFFAQVNAQLFTSKGKEFWMGFMQNNSTTSTPVMDIYITSKVNTSGVVEVPLQAWSQAFTVNANGSVKITVPVNIAHTTGSGTVQPKGIKITAQDTVSVYAYNDLSIISDATFVLPVQSLANEYVVMAHWESGASNQTRESEFLIAAIQNNTLIEIIPSVNTVNGWVAGTTYQTTLNAGEVFQVQAANDLSGSRVRSVVQGGSSCSNFALFGGANLINVGGCNTGDHLYNQILPLYVWGTEYVSAPYLTRNGDFFKIVAAENGTQVQINGGAVINLNAGQRHTFTTTNASYISSNKPISVAQYSRGGRCQGLTFNADPFMITLNPINNITKYAIANSIFTTSTNTHYINIITKTTNVSRVFLNGNNIGTQFTAIATKPDYAMARLTVAQQDHIIESDSGFQAYLYAFWNNGSYGYSAGIDVVTFIPEIVIAPVDPNIPSGNICPNTALQFTAPSVLNANDYQWNFGDGNTATGQTTTHTYTQQGLYDVTLVVKRDAFCLVDTVRTTVTVQGPQTVLPDTLTTCAGEPVTITASGGNSYLWSTGETTASITVSPTSNTFYWARINDAQCLGIPDTVVVIVKNVTASFQAEILCAGDPVQFNNTSQALDDVITGYSWNFGDSNTSALENPSHTYVSGGNNFTVTLTITTQSGCTATTTTLITLPSPISISETITNVSCVALNSGAIDITPSDGTPPYTFNWSNGATTQNIDSLVANDYSLTITDANNCSVSETYTVASAGVLSITTTVVDATCKGIDDGGISLNVSGGNLPYTFLWSNGSTIQNISNLPSGNYTVTVSDADKCAEIISVEVDDISTIVFSSVITGVVCESDSVGAIKLLTSGGTAPYTLLWSTGGTTETITELVSGSYSVTATDANGCTGDTTWVVPAANVFVAEVFAENIACDGSEKGSASVTVQPSGNYNFEWNTGVTTNTINNLEVGIYTVTVTDNANCKKELSTVIAIDTITIEFGNIVKPSCPKIPDGAIEAFPLNGEEPYSYAWSNGDNTKAIENIAVNIYTLTVTDINGCTGTNSVLVEVDITNAENCDSLIIYDVFSPNGDGKNDLWVIDGLSVYPENEIQIYNRWGSLIYEAKPYLNNWDGSNKKGEPLPSATYYYILKLNDFENKVFSGHVTIIR